MTGSSPTREGDLEVAVLPRSAASERVRRLIRSAAFLRTLSVVVVLLLWEFQGRRVDSLFLTPPSDIARAAIDMVSEGDLQTATLNSLYHLGIGVGIAVVVGIPVGLALGRYRLLADMFDSFVDAFYVAPHAAFAPLMLLWFGLGSVTKIVIISTATVFPILINVQAGVRSIEGRLQTLAQAFCLSQWDYFRVVAFPATLSHTVVGLRIGVGRGVTNLVVAEFLTTFTGLGGLILAEGNAFRTSRMFVGIFVLMFIGIILTAFVALAERRVALWRETERASR